MKKKPVEKKPKLNYYRVIVEASCQVFVAASNEDDAIDRATEEISYGDLTLASSHADETFININKKELQDEKRNADVVIL